MVALSQPPTPMAAAAVTAAEIYSGWNWWEPLAFYWIVLLGTWVASCSLVCCSVPVVFCWLLLRLTAMELLS